MMVPYMTCQYMAMQMHPTTSGDNNPDDDDCGDTIAKFISNVGGMVDIPFPKSMKNPKLS